MAVIVGVITVSEDLLFGGKEIFLQKVRGDFKTPKIPQNPYKKL